MTTFMSILLRAVIAVLVLSGGVYSLWMFGTGISEPKACHDLAWLPVSQVGGQVKMACTHADHRMFVEGQFVFCRCPLASKEKVDD